MDALRKHLKRRVYFRKKSIAILNEEILMVFFQCDLSVLLLCSVNGSICVLLQAKRHLSDKERGDGA